jgi:hypothetical protein
MVIKVKELEEWLRKLDETDLIAGYIARGGKLHLRVYACNSGPKDYPELVMN